ncbi:MAG: hypothetical protein B7X97_06750 [Methylotenera sp. 17-45-7]|jgi:hypothetical protein|nr:MAG: hypothetical protein B7X97_06750 [Methylotenera sp. 17-45-7]
MDGISHLPEKFEFSHWYSFFLHDQLVETLKSAEEADVFSARIQFKDDSHAKAVEGLSSEEFILWLEHNGYKEEVLVLYYKQLCAALLSDFLHFIYESLKCSRKGKLTVAYALLRKPLKENLFFMEWLLARPDDFLERFEKENPHRFRLPFSEELIESEHIAIIGEAIDNTKTGRWMTPEFIHELRFKKNSPISLEPLWQKANHLVTTFKHMETEECNLNFVFSSSDAYHSQWTGYYQFVPILLFHSVEVIEALLKRFARRENEEADLMPLRTVAGMMLYLKNPPWESDMAETISNFGASLQEAGLNCPKCGEAFQFHQKNISLFYESGSLECEHGCGEICLHQ